MAKVKGDITIGYRMAEEVTRICTERKIKLYMFAPKSIRNDWKNGVCPGGLYLARLHYFGGDVIYVITGQRRAVEDKNENRNNQNKG